MTAVRVVKGFGSKVFVSVRLQLELIAHMLHPLLAVGNSVHPPETRGVGLTLAQGSLSTNDPRRFHSKTLELLPVMQSWTICAITSRTIATLRFEETQQTSDRHSEQVNHSPIGACVGATVVRIPGSASVEAQKLQL
jgi:hypothetical protein